MSAECGQNTPAARQRANVRIGPRHDPSDRRHAGPAAIPGNTQDPSADGARNRQRRGSGLDMEFTIRFLGLELFHVAASTDVAECAHEDDGGDVMTYPIGFTACHELPDEAGLRDRQEWGE